MNLRNTELFTLALFIGSITIFSGYTAPANPPCPETNPDREILSKAVQKENIGFARQFLEDGGDVNETWRDTPYQICRSLLLRSVWYGQPDIIQLLIENGANLEGIQEYLKIPVRRGDMTVVKMLLEAGIHPEMNSVFLNEVLKSRSPEMLQLLLPYELKFEPLELSLHLLTHETTRILIPRYLDPNEFVWIGSEVCQVYEVFDLLSDENHYCEGSIGPVWIHFLLTGDHETVSFMLNSGAEVYTEAILPISFSALEAARALGDDRMIQLLLQFTDE
jgi:hypothetical protein